MPLDSNRWLVVEYSCGKIRIGDQGIKMDRTLTLHETNPNYAPPNDGEPFEEFDFDTWFENQPEGTFVQGGGIDEENSQK